jgi:hypothetical protein
MQIQSNYLPRDGTIDCSNLSTGFYILNLENQSGEKKGEGFERIKSLYFSSIKKSHFKHF